MLGRAGGTGKWLCVSVVRQQAAHVCLSEVWSVKLLPLRVLLGLFWFGALATVVSAERNPGAEVHISTKWNQCQSSFGIPWGPLVLPCLCSDLSDASASFQSKGSCSQHSQSASRPFLQSFPLYLLVPWSMENEDLYLELCTLPNSFHVRPSSIQLKPHLSLGQEWRGKELHERGIQHSPEPLSAPCDHLQIITFVAFVYFCFYSLFKKSYIQFSSVSGAQFYKFQWIHTVYMSCL